PKTPTTTKTPSVTIKAKPLVGGRVSWFLYFRPALPDGKALLPLKQFHREEDRPKVEAIAETYRATMRKVDKGPKAETCEAYFERYCKFQKVNGISDVDKKRTRWEKWISPKIGRKAITGPSRVTKSDIEDVRDALDVAIA